MKQTIINGTGYRYLSELPEFSEFIPHGIVNKTKTDVGGTYVACNCKSDYIIICPFKDLVNSIYLDENNKYKTFKCYGGVKELSLIKYIEECNNTNSPKKLIVTYDSLPKLIRWLRSADNLENYKLLIDEYHLLLEDFDFRDDAINGLINEVTRFEHYTFLSATPIDDKYNIEFFEELPRYKIIWDDVTTIIPRRYKTTNIPKSLVRLIQQFNEGLSLPDVNNNLSEVKELYIFVNSLTTIKQVLDTLDETPEDVKICCADRIRNIKFLDKYTVDTPASPNKRINFFTKKCFQGCNLFTNNGLIVVASDCSKIYSLVDISTTMEQIVGRLRYNNEYQNIFRNTLVHLYTVNNNMLTDDEFNEVLEKKRIKATDLVEGFKVLSESQRTAYLSISNLTSELVTYTGTDLYINPMKEQSFIYKHELRKTYKDGISVRNAYLKSDKFVDTTQMWINADVILKKITTFNYKDMIIDYYNNPSPEYLDEYPEFRDYLRYLKLSEINTIRYNKEKLLNLVKEKQLLSKVFSEISETTFIPSKELKKLFETLFKKYDINNISPKASLITSCNFLTAKAITRMYNNKSTKGYSIAKSKELRFNI